MLTIEEAVALSLLAHRPRVAALEHLRGHPGGSLRDLLAAGTPGQPPDDRAEELRERARKRIGSPPSAAEAVCWGAPAYPSRLASITDAPFVLWFTGDLSCLARPTVAIVGSRAATPYGLEAASRLAGDLAAAGVVIVSGLARGIDSAAHRAALAAGGETVAVLGSGVDAIYPREHTRLAGEIAAHGAVVSEYPPGTPPAAFHFPARNRIISGLSRAVVVVEAAERSGSLITADFALEQGREVLAVPGSVLTQRHRGCHGLIREGAAIVETAEDVLAELSAVAPAGAGRQEAAISDPLVQLMAAGESYDLEALGAETGLSPAQLLPRLLELELRGAVRRVGGGRFVRAGRTC